MGAQALVSGEALCVPSAAWSTLLTVHYLQRLLPFRLSHASRLLLGTAWALGVVAMVIAMREGDGGGGGLLEQGLVDGGDTAQPSSPGSDSLGMAGVESTPSGQNGEGSIAAPLTPIAGPAVTDGRFAMPLAAWSHPTDRYGAPRGYGYIHGGIDLAVDGLEYSPVYAACDGEVDTMEYRSSYGLHVVVDCGDAWATLYAHLSDASVAAGDRVVKGVTVLGHTGTSGFSTGEHLHFEIIYDGTRVNPEHYLDFKIPPGTPLSNGPIWFPGSGGTWPPPTSTNTPTPTPTPTDTPIPTATRPAMATNTPTPVTPTPRPTHTPTPTPTMAPPTATPTLLPQAF